MHTIGILVSVSIIAGIQAVTLLWYDSKFDIHMVILNKIFQIILA